MSETETDSKDKPADDYSEGTKEWVVGRVIEFPEGTKEWYVEGDS